MSNVYKLTSEKRTRQEATAWLAKLDRGLSSEEEKTLRAWMQESPENPVLFLEVAKLWDKMAALSRLSDLFPDTTSHNTRRPRLAAAAAAIAVLAILWGIAVRDSGPQLDRDPVSLEPPVHTVYETAIGEQSTIALSDGSQVVLNTNSRLRVRYSAYHRVLTLLRGEVHVDVARDASRPLSVIVGDNIVQALGTAFGVEITNNREIELVVTEGEVLVGVRPSPLDASQTSSTPVLPSSAVTVARGEELRLGSPGAQVETVSPEEIEVKLSWREGNLIFRGEPLEEAMKEVGRYTTVEFVFLNDAIKQYPIAGRYRAGDVEGLLAALRENFNIAYERTDDDRILLSSL